MSGWQPIVGSQHLAAAQYDDERQVLQVKFRRSPDKVYTYHAVPPSQFSAMMNAVRPGQHFRDHIKSRYRHSGSEE